MIILATDKSETQMGRKFDKTEWISESNKGQLEWLKKHLTSLGIQNFGFTPQDLLEGELRAYFNSYDENNYEHKKTIQKIKSSWRTHKNIYYRKEDEKQKCFMLPVDAIKRLEFLSKANKTTLNDTISLIINDEYASSMRENREIQERAKEQRKNNKQEKHLLSARKTFLSGPIKSLQGKNLSLQNRLSTLESNHSDLISKYKATIKLMCEFMVKPEDKTLIAVPLTEKQAEEAEMHYQDIMKNEGLNEM